VDVVNWGWVGGFTTSGEYLMGLRAGRFGVRGHI
jgi:hypothetical protein